MESGHTLDAASAALSRRTQLAAALEVHVERRRYGFPLLTLASADTDLTLAATAEGVTVGNPNSHP